MPELWTGVPLGEVATLSIGRTPDRATRQFWANGQEDGLPWLTIRDLNDQHVVSTSREQISHLGRAASRARPVPVGTLLMSFKLSIGKVALAGAELFTNEAIVAIAGDEDRVLTDWLYYVLPVVVAGAASDQAIKGVTLNLAKLRSLSVPLPPLDAQRRIVALLRRVHDAEMRATRLGHKLAGVRIGHLESMLQAAGDPMEGGGTLARRPLAELADVAAGVTLGRKLPRFGTVELPYLRVANVQDGFLNLSEVKTVRVRPKEISRYRLKPGDVLMNEGGDYDKLGRGTVWQGEIADCLHQNVVLRARCSEPLLPQYLAALARSSYGRRYFSRVSKQSTNMAHLGISQLEALPVPLPQMAEQQAIADLLAVYDRRIASERVAAGKYRAIRDGVLSDFLAGRVTAAA